MAHDDVANTVVNTTEVDHQAGAKDYEWLTEEQAEVLEVLSLVDDDTDDHTPEARANVVYLSHVSSVPDVEVVNYVKEILHVGVPAVKAEVHKSGQDTSTSNRAVLEHFLTNKMRPCEELLPDGENREKNDSDDNHRNESSA